MILYEVIGGFVILSLIIIGVVRVVQYVEYTTRLREAAEEMRDNDRPESKAGDIKEEPSKPIRARPPWWGW